VLIAACRERLRKYVTRKEDLSFDSLLRANVKMYHRKVHKCPGVNLSRDCATVLNVISA
jgi:hypothetical protein